MPKFTTTLNSAFTHKADADVDLILLRQNMRERIEPYSKGKLLEAVTRCEAATAELRTALEYEPDHD